jgi:hypothetical protein
MATIAVAFVGQQNLASERILMSLLSLSQTATEFVAVFTAIALLQYYFASQLGAA